jgi:hypothetical protein
MHPMHEDQINRRYTPAAIEGARKQLANAIRAANATTGPAATYWSAWIEQLVGRIAIAKSGGTIQDAAKFLDDSI